MSTPSRARVAIPVLAAVLLASVVLAVAFGAVWISPGTTLRLFAWKVGLTGRPAGIPEPMAVILFQLRLPRVLLAALVGAALAIAVAMGSVGDLNLTALGEERAAQLGLEVERFKRVMLAAGALLTAAAVSVSGLIGFVGLMTPHIMRLLVGSDHRKLIPA